MNVTLTLVLLSSLSIATKVESLDLTLVSGASGADVVRAVISKIEASNSFIHFRPETAAAPFMRRMAYIETRDGYSNSSNGGIWNVDEGLFRRTQSLGNDTQIDLAIARLQENNPQNYIGPVNWRNLTYDSLSIPLYSGLAVRMLIHLDDALPLTHLYPLYWNNVFKGGRSSINQWNDGVAQLSVHEVCKLNIDLVFVLDTSGSIGYDNFKNVKVFVHNFTSNILTDTTVNRVGVITFSTRGQVYTALNSTIEKDELLETIANLPYYGGSTRTELGLELMRQQEWRNEVSVFRLAIVLTDGASNIKPATLYAARAVHDHEPPIVVYSIGVGGSTDQDELEAIASGVEFITHLNSFDADVLDSTRDGYTYQICFNATQDLSFSTAENGIIGMGVTARLRFMADVAEGMTFRLCLRQGQITIYSSTIPNPNSAQHIWRDTVTANAELPRTCLTVFYELSQNSNTNRQLKRQISTDVVSLYITLEGQDELNKFTFNSSKGNITFGMYTQLKLINLNDCGPYNCYNTNECVECEDKTCDPNADCFNTIWM